VALARNRRWARRWVHRQQVAARNRLDARCLMGRVHHELFERFKRVRSLCCAHVAENESARVLQEMCQRCEELRTQEAGIGRFTAEMKHIMLSMAEYSPKPGESHTGVHISEVLQVPDLMDMILRDVECKRHALRFEQRPNLKILALRYGVTETAIRKCNGLDDGRGIGISYKVKDHAKKCHSCVHHHLAASQK